MVNSEWFWMALRSNAFIKTVAGGDPLFSARCTLHAAHYFCERKNHNIASFGSVTAIRQTGMRTAARKLTA